MKKSLVMSLVVMATFAFVGATFAMNCGLPPVCEELFITKSKPWTGHWMTPKKRPILPPRCVTPKCGPCYTIPGTPYAIAPVLEDKVFEFPAEVRRDLCLGKASGKCKLGCGPCAPDIKWSGSWRTSEVLPDTIVKIKLPPAYAPVQEPLPKDRVGVWPIVPPCPPRDCYGY
jgi:hypothetical protein